MTPNQPGRAPDCNLLEGTAGLMRSSRIGSMPKIAANSPSPPGLDGSVDKSLLRRRARNGGEEGSRARRPGANLGAFSRHEIQLGSQLSRDSHRRQAGGRAAEQIQVCCPYLLLPIPFTGPPLQGRWWPGKCPGNASGSPGCFSSSLSGEEIADPFHNSCYF